MGEKLTGRFSLYFEVLINQFNHSKQLLFSKYPFLHKPPGIGGQLQFIGHNEDCSFIFHHMTKCQLCPSHPRFDLRLSPQVFPPLYQHTDKFTSLQLKILVIDLIDYHLATRLNPSLTSPVRRREAPSFKTE